jgi:hypothetical protein
MNLRFRHELRQLINKHGVDTELNRPDWFIETSITNYIKEIQSFSRKIEHCTVAPNQEKAVVEQKNYRTCSQCRFLQIAGISSDGLAKCLNHDFMPIWERDHFPPISYPEYYTCPLFEQKEGS